MSRRSSSVDLLDSAVTDRRYKFAIENSLTVVVRATVIGVPRIIRIIIRRVESIIFRLGRPEPVVGVLNIGAAAKQKSHGADQRKDGYYVPTLFPFSCHAFGALI